MEKNNICKALSNLIDENSKNLFKYDPEKNLIYVDKAIKENTQTHEILFKELKKITNNLNGVDCNYSVDEQGDIILHCDDKETNCFIKCCL